MPKGCDVVHGRNSVRRCPKAVRLIVNIRRSTPQCPKVVRWCATTNCPKAVRD